MGSEKRLGVDYALRSQNGAITLAL